MKYRITKEDLKKRGYGSFMDGIDDRFLVFISQEEKANNPILSSAHISKLEHKTKKGIYFNIWALILLGVICLVFGLHQFLYKAPLIGVNLYTQFPLIANGSIEIVGSLALIFGSIYSYLKRDAVLERLVKSKLIEDLKKIQQEKSIKPVSMSKKRKRFRQSYKVGKKR